MPPKVRTSRRSKNSAKRTEVEKKGTVFASEEGQTYGRVLRRLGCGQYEIRCNDNAVRICYLRGATSFHKGRNKGRKEAITIGDIVLVSIRDFQPRFGDILAKYSERDIELLRTRHYIDMIDMDNDDDEWGLEAVERTLTPIADDASVSDQSSDEDSKSSNDTSNEDSDTSDDTSNATSDTSEEASDTVWDESANARVPHAPYRRPPGHEESEDSLEDLLGTI